VITEWEPYSDDDPYMHPERMVNGNVLLAKGDDRVTGKGVSVRSLPFQSFITIDGGSGPVEYPLDGPFMWDILGYTKGEPEVGNTVVLKRKMTTVVGPVRRIDRLADGIGLHVPDYPAPLFVGNRHDTWKVVRITR
jgi:hypothetical protein